MTKTLALRASSMTLVGSAIVAAGVFAAGAAHAEEEGVEPGGPFHRFVHFQGQGKAWQSAVNPQHIEHLAEMLDTSVEDLQPLLETEDGREQVHMQIKELHKERRLARLTSLAEELDMTVEDLQAAKDDPERWAQIREQIKELGIAPPERPGHPRNFGEFRSRLNHR